MAQYSDNAPIGNTCSIIDDIVSRLESAKGEARYIVKHADEDNTEEAHTILDELISVISDMENIRSDNQELRHWGNDEYARAESLETEIDDLKMQIEELQNKFSEIESVK